MGDNQDKIVPVSSSSNHHQSPLVNASGQTVYNSVSKPSFDDNRDISVNATTNQAGSVCLNEEESSASKSWEIYFLMLKQHKENEGHCNIPESNEVLTTWVSEQRRQYLSQKMSKARVSKLEALGFVWSNESSLWNARYEEIKQFKAEHFHFPGFKTDFGKWRWAWKWEKQQRKHYDLRRRGKESPLTDDQIVKLVQIDFEGLYGDFLNKYIWEARYQQFKKFKDEHGHCKVPARYYPLCTWVERCRRDYMSFKNEKNSPMNREQAEMFDEIGVDWNTISEVCKSGEGHLFTTSGDRSWDTKYSDLKDFKARHGHCTRFPPTDADIRRWTDIQRDNFQNLMEGKDSSLTVEKLLMLEDLKFEFRRDVHKKNIKWERNFQNLLLFKAKHGHLNMPVDQKKLRNWKEENFHAYHMIKLADRGGEMHGKVWNITREQVERLNLIFTESGTMTTANNDDKNAQGCNNSDEGSGVLKVSHGIKRKTTEESDNPREKKRLTHIRCSISEDTSGSTVKQANSLIDDSLKLLHRQETPTSIVPTLQPQMNSSSEAENGADNGEHIWLSRYCDELKRFKDTGSKAYDVWETWQAERHRLYIEGMQSGFTGGRINELEAIGMESMSYCYEDVNVWKPSEGHTCIFQGMEILGSVSV